jgi:hypothetical protein
VKLRPQLEKCLRHFADSTPAAIVKEFGLGEPVFAETLKKRSEDLLKHGLPKALERANAHEFEISMARLYKCVGCTS